MTCVTILGSVNQLEVWLWFVYLFLFLMNLGNSISKYWIYKWIYVSNLQTRSNSSGFTQTIPSKKQASCTSH